MSTKRKLSAKLGQPQVKQSAKPVTKEQINDAKAVVTGGINTEEAFVNGEDEEVVEISSDSSSNDDEDEDSENDEEEVTQQTTPGNSLQIQKPTQDDDEEMGEADHDPQEPTANGEDQDQDQAEPSFGDLIHATTNTIDVASFANPSPHPTTLTNAAPTNSASLGTVLSQALRTNDTSLLESCLSTPDPATIRATIQRLSSPLASTLLSKLAERLHRRPGRAGSLMVWVQWTLVTHGGYLATQKDLVSQLRELNKVIEERARSLSSLLSLKGKLDMLEAQMQLRRSVRREREVDEDEEDEAVIYVEDSDSEDAQSASEEVKKQRPNGVARRASTSSSVSEDMPNGLSAEGIAGEEYDSESEEEGSSSGEGEDLIDDEAEESDADEDEIDHDEVDEADEDEESDDGGAGVAPGRGAGPPPTKMQKVGGMFSRRR